jgi:ubiquitin-conjugating enzyme E2 variant
MMSRPPRLPRNYALPRSQFVFSWVSIAAAYLLFTAFTLRIALTLDLRQWWVLAAFGVGMATADFASGLVHWAADTWGRDDLPVIGRRLLVPFRIHHINPEEFLERPFLETNGDVSFLGIPTIGCLLVVPLDTPWGGPLSIFGLGLCGVGMLTNQIHQWAHMPSPPRSVRVLQNCRLILGCAEHARHHRRPFDDSYCITTGWCNGPLARISFFRRLEQCVTWATGLVPRRDDRRYEERYRPGVAEGWSV